MHRQGGCTAQSIRQACLSFSTVEHGFSGDNMQYWLCIRSRQGMLQHLILQQVCHFSEAAPALHSVLQVKAVCAPELCERRHDALGEVVLLAEHVNLPLHIGQPVPVAIWLPSLRMHILDDWGAQLRGLHHNDAPAGLQHLGDRAHYCVRRYNTSRVGDDYTDRAMGHSRAVDCDRDCIQLLHNILKMKCAQCSNQYT